MSVNTITCPTGCDSVVPDWSFSVCDPNIDFGEIQKVYMGNVGEPLVDVTDLAEWLTRLAAADETKIEELHVSAEMPEPETTEFDISLCRKAYGLSSWTINVEIDETGIENYEAMMQTHCNSTNLFWFTSGKYIYGGNDGIEGQLKLSPLIPKGCKEIKKFVGKITWTAQYPPYIALNPFA